MPPNPPPTKVKAKKALLRGSRWGCSGGLGLLDKLDDRLLRVRHLTFRCLRCLCRCVVLGVVVPVEWLSSGRLPINRLENSFAFQMHADACTAHVHNIAHVHMDMHRCMQIRVRSS